MPIRKRRQPLLQAGAKQPCFSRLTDIATQYAAREHLGLLIGAVGTPQDMKTTEIERRGILTRESGATGFKLPHQRASAPAAPTHLQGTNQGCFVPNRVL